MLFKNYEELFPTKLSESQYTLRKIGLKALEIAVNAVRPKNLIEKAIRIEKKTITVKNDEYDLNTFKRIYIVGGGKCVAEMAFTLEEMLKAYPSADYYGFVNVPEGLDINYSKEKSKIKLNYAKHPIPSMSGFYGTKSMLELLEKSTDFQEKIDIYTPNQKLTNLLYKSTGSDFLISWILF